VKGVARLSIFLAAVGCAQPRSAATPSAAEPAPTAPAPISSVAGPAGTLSVDDGGRGGLPVLFVHGNGGNKSQWAAQLAHLRQTRRAVAFDLRGMGKSAPAADADYSVEAFAADLAAVADAFRLSRFVLVGHSFGGAVVCAYAARHPDRPAALVFADVAGDLRGTPADQVEGLKRSLESANYFQFTDAWFNSILANATAETRAAVLASLHATPPEVFTSAALDLYSFPLREALGRFSGPRISIASYLAGNPLAIDGSGEGIPVRGIAGASHWLMMDKPLEFNRLLDEFLAGLPA
jgi:pimeloyl-ACP methyl ester carboxylesterase